MFADFGHALRAPEQSAIGACNNPDACDWHADCDCWVGCKEPAGTAAFALLRSQGPLQEPP